MTNKKLTLVRIYDMDKLKLKDLSLELSNLQKAKVSAPEIIRRAFNIPNIRDILANDAIGKRRLRR